jgi:hypothetical protein
MTDMIGGVVVGMLSWAGFMLPMLLTMYTLEGRKPALLLINGGYWFLACVIMGGIIGIWP